MLASNRFMFAVVLVITTLSLWLQHDQGWIAHDEGLLGQSATRVLDGELPHLDFDDPYTGGLAVWHAAAMSVFGVHSLAFRWALLLSSVAASVVTYLIATRFSPPWLAGLVALLSLAWGVPNYFAALPSWYNLHLALLGTYALLRHDESGKRSWLIVAGVLGGLSFLVKVSGLYYVAAGLLFLVYREQLSSAAQIDADPEQEANSKPIGFAIFTTASLVLFGVLLWVLIRRRATSMDWLHFVVPGVSIATFLIWNLVRGPQGFHGQSWLRWKRLFASVAWFAAGVMLPVFVFLIPYAMRSGVGVFLSGVFIAPQKRFEFAAFPLPPLTSLLAMVPMASLLVTPFFLNKRSNPLWLTGLAWIVCLFALCIVWQSPLYETIWDSVRSLIPMVVAIGLVSLIRGEPDPNVFLLLAMSAMVSLVQFPYSFAIYFCYAIPIGILAIAAIVQRQPAAPTHLHLVVAVFYLGFAAIFLNHSRVQRMGTQFVFDDQNTVLDLPRSGLRVSESQANLYTRVVKEVWRHSDDGSTIYATADCPEIYFLADRKNPTRSFYEFFESDFGGDLQTRVKRIDALLASQSIDVVVLHWNGEFSGRIPMELSQSIASRYPNVAHFVRDPAGNPNQEPVFSVAWREPTP